MTFSADEILTYRREKDQAFRTESGSPIPLEERAHFAGLHYYPPDKTYYVPTRLAPETAGRALVLPTSDGDERRMIVAGHYDFQLQGKPVRLYGYRNDTADEDVFLPFRDATAPKETYGAGRYMDVPYRPNQLIFLDLNYAYNPYCAYNDAYSCPFPPRENWVDVAIRAGERNYRDYTGSNL